MTQDFNTTIDQIGRGNLAAISGMRVRHDGDTLVLPVSDGYSVEIDLAWDDTYTVRRMFRRAGQAFPKGEQTGVYCDELGETAYQASCFRSNPFGA